MKSLAMFLLEAWYLECRKMVPAATSRRINAGIRGFAASSVEVQKAIELAKKSAAAASARRRRGDTASALSRRTRFAADLKHIPCRKIET